MNATITIVLSNTGGSFTLSPASPDEIIGDINFGRAYGLAISTAEAAVIETLKALSDKRQALFMLGVIEGLGKTFTSPSVTIVSRDL